MRSIISGGVFYLDDDGMNTGIFFESLLLRVARLGPLGLLSRRGLYDPRSRQRGGSLARVY